MYQYMKLENAQHYVQDRVPHEELLAQLAEEAAELTHAALKLRRALDGTSPTPVNAPAARAALDEEVADVLLLIHLLGLDDSPGKLEGIMDYKLLRWQHRLVEAGK